MSSPTQRSVDVEQGKIEAERLCRHHNILDFDCGDELLNAALKTYRERTDGGLGPIVFVAVNESRVLGYVALEDLIVRSVGDESRHYLALPAIAIDKEYQGRDILVFLLKKVLAFMHLREKEERSYDGMVVYPYTRSAERALKRFGFEPIPDLEFWWRGPLPIRHEYRRSSGAHRWHFCPSCPGWPSTDYEASFAPPPFEDLDDDCLSLELQGGCRPTAKSG